MKTSLAWFIPLALLIAPAPTTKPAEIAVNDDVAAGKKSIAGSGHAVVLDSPADGGKLTAVRIFGSRYPAAAGGGFSRLAV